MRSLLTPRLMNAIGDDPTRCLLWVGAGLSKVGVRGRNQGLPDWQELMCAMIDYLREEGQPTSLIERLEKHLEADPPRYAKIADASP